MTAPLPTRRRFLGGAAVLPAALALGGPVGASTETPIRVLFRRYMALLERIRVHNFALGEKAWRKQETTTDDREALDLKLEIEAEPITSMEDLALVLWVVTGGLAGPPSEVRDRCRDFLAEENLQ